MHSERLLLGPGPSNPFPEVVEAMTRPVLGHLDPEFLALLDETCERLRTVFRTSNPLTLPVSGTGSAGMEAALVNLVGEGDVVVVGVNGLFGERLCDVAGRCGAEVVRIDEEWGRAIDPERLVAAHPSCDILVNNLGVCKQQDFFEIPDSEWTRFFVMSGVRLSRTICRE